MRGKWGKSAGRTQDTRDAVHIGLGNSVVVLCDVAGRPMDLPIWLSNAATFLPPVDYINVRARIDGVVTPFVHYAPREWALSLLSRTDMHVDIKEPEHYTRLINRFITKKERFVQAGYAPPGLFFDGRIVNIHDHDELSMKATNSNWYALGEVVHGVNKVDFSLVFGTPGTGGLSYRIHADMYPRTVEITSYEMDT